MISAV
ncbi:hypothetical protein YPPY12_1888, partial [Yersinia pestis PY-12]